MSDGEIAFDRLFRLVAKMSVQWQPNFQVNPAREWTTDFAIEKLCVAVEIEGFGHKITGRYLSDIEKYNWMASHGWVLLRYTPQMMRDCPAQCIEEVCEAVTRRMEGRI